MRRLALLVLPVALSGLLVACGGASQTGGSADLPEVNGRVRRQAEGDRRQGQKPAKKLESPTVSQGEGPKVEKGDLLVADYLG